ncbi:site-specific integrase, partial [Enterococcus faecalis]|uniref:site-specific integrase n=1 Tax=Enterococcus faecalis TaxID=1351 RepID=UPI003CC6BD77
MQEQLVDYLHYLQIERGLSNNTRRSNERDLKKYVAFLQEQGLHSLVEVDRYMITEFLQSLHEEQQ